ncbi:MAG TPA: hypothetical protein VJM47_01565 [Nitrosospira sp.]|nr:hypothetical protein [Nitrosospira sp.]
MRLDQGFLTLYAYLWQQDVATVAQQLIVIHVENVRRHRECYWISPFFHREVAE